MYEAPQTGERILILTETFGFDGYARAYKKTGTQWVDAFWSKDLSGEETWIPWCGNANILTTETLSPLGWVPLPKI